MTVLTVQGLSKTYRRYASETRRVLGWFGVAVQPIEQHQVLADLSFVVQPGEAVGIIGRNGAGKSTLLKLITGTQRPTTGTVQLNGQVAAILELGMGFNPEFTGRHNAQHALSLMGFVPDQIAHLLPAIEAFAEIGDYFDQPLRTYSSGMQMRVAFAVVTAQRPDLLIVDEALAVGDAYFQHKCFNRMQTFRNQGSAILLVSHDRGAIINLCDRTVLLEQGRLISDGEPRVVFDTYNSLIADQEAQQAAQLAQQGVSRYGDGRATILQVITGQDDQPAECFMVGSPMWVEVHWRVESALSELTVGLLFRDRLGNDIFGTNTQHLNINLRDLPTDSEHKLRFNIQRLVLGAGNYHLTVALHAGVEHASGNYDWWDAAASITVLSRPDYPFAGVAELQVTPQKPV